LEECGRAALPGPLVEHAAVAVPALAAAASAGWLRAAAAGDIVVTAASGPSTVPFGGEADLVLVERDGAVHAVERPDIIRCEPRTSVDRSRRFADVTWSRATPLPGADPELLRSRAAAATAAVLCGLAVYLIE